MIKLNKGKLVAYPLLLTLITCYAADKLVLDNNDDRLTIVSAYNDNNSVKEMK